MADGSSLGRKARGTALVKVAGGEVFEVPRFFTHDLRLFRDAPHLTLPLRATHSFRSVPSLKLNRAPITHHGTEPRGHGR